MALATSIVGQNLGRSAQEDSPPECPILPIAVKEQWRLADAVRSKTLAKLPVNRKSRLAAKLAGLDEEMPSVRHQTLDLFEHPPREFWIFRGKGHNDRFRFLADQTEEESLQRGFHSAQ